MTTEDYVKKIKNGRSIADGVAKANKHIRRGIEQENKQLLEECVKELEAMTKRLVEESKAWPSGTRKRLLAEKIEWESGCMQAKYVSRQHNLVHGKNGIISFSFAYPTEMEPMDILSGDITIMQAVEAANKLYTDAPKWLTDMVSATEYAEKYEAGVTAQEYKDNEYKRHGGDRLDRATMNIVMNNVDDMSYYMCKDGKDEVSRM